MTSHSAVPNVQTDRNTHPQRPQLPNTSCHQHNPLNRRVQYGPGIGLFTLIPKSSLPLPLKLLFLPDIFQFGIQIVHPTGQIGNVRSIGGGIVRFGFSDDDVQMESHLRGSFLGIVDELIRRSYGETDLMITCDVRGEGEFTFRGGYGVDELMTVVLFLICVWEQRTM